MKSLLIVQDLHATALLRIRRDALGKRGSPFRAALIVGGRAWASIAGTFIVMRILTLLVFAMMYFFVEEFKGNIRVRIHDLCAAGARRLPVSASVAAPARGLRPSCRRDQISHWICYCSGLTLEIGASESEHWQLLRHFGGKSRAV
jgi:hypothetical protein